MRRASVAIVPLLIGIFLIFWVIWFLGEESDNTKIISKTVRLEDLHENIAMYAMKRKIELIRENNQKPPAQRLNQQDLESYVKQTVNQEVRAMMIKNGIDK